MSMSEGVRRRMQEGSWIRRMFEEGARLKQRYGERNVFDLSIGNPVMEPPPQFHRELLELASRPVPGMHRYMPNAGYDETRAAVAAQLRRELGLEFAADGVVMTCGAAGGMCVALKTLINPGEEVIIFRPFFVEYLNYVDNVGGVPRLLASDGAFLPRLDELEAAISERTRALILNSPHNPTGVVYPPEVLRGIGEVLQRKEGQYGRPVYILSDEAYSNLVYDGLSFPSPAQFHRHTLVVRSYSKDLALPGERIGFVALHPECADRSDLFGGLVFCNRTLGFVNASALMQHIVRHLQGVTVSVAEYQQKRDFMLDNLTEMGYQMVKPRGAFYIFPRSPIEDDVAFVRELLQLKVLTVPGSGFGTPGYFRIAYCVEDKVLEGSLDGLRQAAQKYGLTK